MECKDEISSFRGAFSFLSNFYPAAVEYEGDIYPTVENAYQAAKTLDRRLRPQFVNCRPSTAKRLGRALSVRPDWLRVREKIMNDLLVKKFSDEWMAKKLLETGDRPLVEGNKWGDTFWGRCDGVGVNKLGMILMEIRSSIREARRRERSIGERLERIAEVKQARARRGQYV